MSEQASVKRGPRAVLALFLCLAASGAWMLTLDVPWMRSSGFAGWVCLAIGIALGFSAMRADKRLRTRITFGLDVLLLALFVFVFFGAARLPASEQARAQTRAPDFALVDEQGRIVTLANELARGPVLLVFYRGYW